MRKRRVAASAALILSVGSLTPTVAQAATATRLYVNNVAGSHCTDAGSGTEAAPYCTVQVAANEVTAGQTVIVEPGYYSGAIAITHSGTAAAPITFETATPGQQFQNGTPEVGDGVVDEPAFVFNGASYVTVSGLSIGAVGGEAALVENSSHITIDSLMDVEGDSDPAPVIHVTGGSSYVTVSRDYFSNIGHTATVQIEAGSSHDTITTNALVGQSGGFLVDGAPDTVITSNSFDWVCNFGVDLFGASTGSTIENNATYVVNDHTDVSQCPADTGSLVSFEVDSPANSGTTLDYNDAYALTQNGPSVGPYDWAGTLYEDPAALYSGTGQGAHDFSANPDAFPTPLSGASPLINTANSDAPGELSTDLYGNARVDDPSVANKGAGDFTYYDVGAVQYEDPLAVAPTMNTQTGTVPATLTATEAVTTKGWASVREWTINFGDGSPASTTVSPVSVPHTYTKPGTYTVTLTAYDGFGTDGRGSASATTTVRILANDVFHPVTATRLLDTHTGTGTGGVTAPVKAGSTLKLKIEGAGPIPASGVTAVVLNLTATDTTGGGYVIAYADGTTLPGTSNLNYSKGESVADQVVVQVGKDGEVDLANVGSGSADLIADVAGYYGPGGGEGLQTQSGLPVRILNTSTGLGTGGAAKPVPADGTVKLTSEYLAPGQTEVLNVTVADAKSGGSLTAYPDGVSRPGTSNVTFAAGQTIANKVDVQTGSDGSIDFYNGSGGTVEVTADQLGMFTAAGGQGYTPITPVRVLDTGRGIGAQKGAVKPHTTVVATVAGVDGLPTTLGNVEGNVTVTQATAGGSITVYPGFASAMPTESTQSFSPGITISDATTMGAYKGIDLYNGSAGTSQLALDVFGYYS